jgi:hypothetical protein
VISFRVSVRASGGVSVRIRVRVRVRDQRSLESKFPGK